MLHQSHDALAQRLQLWLPGQVGCLDKREAILVDFAGCRRHHLQESLSKICRVCLKELLPCQDSIRSQVSKQDSLIRMDNDVLFELVGRLALPGAETVAETAQVVGGARGTCLQPVKQTNEIPRTSSETAISDIIACFWPTLGLKVGHTALQYSELLHVASASTLLPSERWWSAEPASSPGFPRLYLSLVHDI
jgi:hypothetical protein